MNFNEEVFTDPEPISYQSRLAARRRKKEAIRFNEPNEPEENNEC